ncbi:DUF4434_domain-containing protein [Hexamita inflata]|uniref:DUF4434 domain-containing protein n=1 Tax=Hexamita inflata TaxID=28002 RepID=A0AA86Q4H6_9EUKA|nr:DUF4434 domain-containing protein [Hexamita inflata]
MSIYLGVYAENDGWWTTPDDAYLFRQRENSIKVIDELLAKFPQTAIKGFYIPHEIARYYWQVPADMQRLVNNFVKPVSDYAHSKNKTMMISPFFNQDLETSAQDYQFFKDMLVNSSVDIIAVQDGVGSNAARRNFSVEYLTAIAKAATETKKQFWTNVELFEGSAPADITRIQDQCVNASSISLKLISYDYSTLTLDHYVQSMQSLYADLIIFNAKYTCIHQNNAYYNSTCYIYCPVNYFKFNNSCVRKCPGESQFIYDSGCVSNCPDNYQIDGINCVLKSGDKTVIIIGAVAGVVLSIAVGSTVAVVCISKKEQKKKKNGIKLSDSCSNVVTY